MRFLIATAVALTACANGVEPLTEVCRSAAEPLVAFMNVHTAADLDRENRLEFTRLVQTAYQACRPDEVVVLRDAAVTPWLAGGPPGDMAS